MPKFHIHSIYIYIRILYIYSNLVIYFSSTQTCHVPPRNSGVNGEASTAKSRPRNSSRSTSVDRGAGEILKKWRGSDHRHTTGVSWNHMDSIEQVNQPLLGEFVGVKYGPIGIFRLCKVF